MRSRIRAEWPEYETRNVGPAELMTSDFRRLGVLRVSLTFRPKFDDYVFLCAQRLTVQQRHCVAPLANSLHHCRNQRDWTADRLYINTVSALSDRGSHFHCPRHFLLVSAR